LIEVSPNENPPVCKIEDYGKMIYKQKKIEKKQKNKQKANAVKGIRISIGIGEHDLEVKLNQAKKFLKDLHPVKICLTLKGRELGQKGIAISRLKEMSAKLEESAQIDQEPKAQGYNVFMILIPKKG